MAVDADNDFKEGLADRAGRGGPGARRAHRGQLAGRLSPGGSGGPGLRAHGWVPPVLNLAQQAALKEAVQHPPRAVGIEQASWHGKVVRSFVGERFGITLARSSCRNYLHRLGFVVKRPNNRQLKANDAKRAAFVVEYASLRTEARTTGAKHFFVDEAHFYADVDPHGLWVLKGLPALVDSTSPRSGEKASYYSAVCLETGEVEAMPLTGNSSAQSSVAFLKQLGAHHTAPLVVFWDNGPAHGGEPLRDYLRSPKLQLRLLRLPASKYPQVCSCSSPASTVLRERGRSDALPATRLHLLPPRMVCM
jgi:hypothetical protein